MPPTIQSGKRDDKGRKTRTGERRSDLICRVKYNNVLPDLPFDPKFITYPFEQNRFVSYNPTSLERNTKSELLTETDLGVSTDLINTDIYKVDPLERLDSEDERLLEEELSSQSDSKRSRHHNKTVSWLRKTEYISTEYNRFTPNADRPEMRVGYNIKKLLKEEDLYRDRESQINAIEKTFEDNKTEITKHYSKPGVLSIEEVPLFPDFEMWKFPCAQVIFDTDPAPKVKALPAVTEEMAQAMIRGMVDESGDQFVAYFLPTEETLSKRKRDAEENVEYTPEEEYDYVLAREYNWNVKNKASKGYEETYFFVFKEDGVYYNELETRVRLSKRRKLTEGPAPTNKSRLIVKHRPINEQELAAQEARLTMLEPPGEEEELEQFEFRPDQVGERKEGSDVENTKEESGGEKSEDEEEKRSEKSGGTRSRSGSSSSSSSSGSDHEGSGKGSGSDAGSGSESEAESEAGKKDEEEIFGSGSDSD
ncbi:RNA polymerase II-associated factor 1 homolog [Lingula anatina]|uniref:RNA polymerase II-associated factor 1 homolog n=1 Tax=Lingula anatina TaxID=7574 RepID=A0A1S3HHV2_LINAN|nr:RNA polymerase II-associated factor 1 homolog [Lingula anatina]|eukprot:XP_013385685.1 RNA polymerase II-associated factor 1 homolog [Lingula anatina]